MANRVEDLHDDMMRSSAASAPSRASSARPADVSGRDSIVTSVKSEDPPTTRAKKIPGEAGVWILILGDMCVFAIFFAIYLVYRGRQPELFAASQATLNRNLGALNTVILLFSSLFVIFAVSRVRQGQVLNARIFLRLAIGCGLGFIVVKVIEYSEKISNGITPDVNQFYTYYFILTGVHLFHLILGLVVLMVLHAMINRSPLTSRRLALLDGGACFWHMVDLLWIVLFPLLFLVR